MRRFRSLRARLTGSFAAVAALLIAVSCAGTAWLLNQAVWNPLDAALEEEAVGLALIGTSNADARSGRAVPAASATEQLVLAVAQLGAERDLGGRKFVVMSNRAGRVLASSGHLPRTIAPQADAGTRFVREGGALYRVVTHRTAAGDTITIGVRANRYAKTITRALWLLGAGGLVLLGGIGLLAWSITTSAVSEIDGLTAELERVEADSFARRVDTRGTAEVDRLAQALNRLLARLERAVRRLQRFTADAAHELRTPLAALRTHLDVALARSASAQADRNALLDASEQTERLVTLAEDLLTLSAIDSGPPTDARPVDMGEIGREAGEFFEAVAQEQGREFGIRIDTDVTVLGEPLLLKRLLLNLLGNAFKHTAAGTPVRLDVRRTPREVILIVHDDGAGLDDAARQVLFERFAAPRKHQIGAGLGLAICREIVSRHQGTITVESRGHGTTATVRLPAVTHATRRRDDTES